MKICNDIPCNMNNYTPKGQRKIEFITLHYTANNGDTARGNCNYFSQPNRNASAHYFVDENEIWQSVQDMDVAWHCGANTYKHDKCRNSNSIGIEMCSRINARGEYYFEPKTIQNTVELVKHLMKKYDIGLENIVRHYDVTGKNCPKPMVNNPLEWITFKNKLGVNDLTVDEAKQIIQDACGFDANTMKYLEFYKYSDSLITRLAHAIKG